ncbi:MAG: rRNA maturation RNase YbeY [Firmicutes bacterium]|nr:rRNA maturation RNase YbeY [Bacillota bacterium]
MTPERLEELAKKSVEATLSAEGRSPDADEVSILFADDGYVRELSRKYLGRDETTDVLAFSMLERTEGEPDAVPPRPPEMLGDVVVSVDAVERQAAEYGHSAEREAAILVVHGILHLLGYDDCDAPGRAAMYDAQERVVAALGL